MHAEGGYMLAPLYLIILIPFLCAAFIPLAGRYLRRVHTGWLALPVPLLLFAYVAKHLPAVAQGGSFSRTLAWIPSLGINYVVYADGLSMLFGLIITGMGALFVFYSIYYLSKEREALGNFYAYLLLFMGAMLFLVFSDNIMVLYLFWELTSISSFLLIAYWYQRKGSRYGAQKALLITVSGGFAMFAGFLLLANIADTFSIRAMIAQAEVMADHRLFPPATVLVLLGAFTKSAQFPFHIWLPDAMEAPTPISAYLHSATMVKAGIYLIARLTPLCGGSSLWFWLVSGVGLITLFWGALLAIKQTDLKAMLAFSTVSQLGLIVCLLGLGSAALYAGSGALPSAAAVLAAIFHLFNHSTFKGCLFMVVGIIDHETGTRDIRRLGGLISAMPLTFTVAMIGSFSMAGLPPFNGFLSKEMFFAGVLEAARLGIFHMEGWGRLFPVIAWTASVFTFIYCMVFVIRGFLGKPGDAALRMKKHEAPFGMLLPPALLAVLVILVFFFPNLVAGSLLVPAAEAVLPGYGAAGLPPIAAWHGVSPELLMTVGVVAAGSILFKLRKKWAAALHRLSPRFSFNFLYNKLLEAGEALCGRATRAYMTGSIRDYLVYIIAFTVLLPGGLMIAVNGFAFAPTDDSPILLYELVLALVMVGAALLVLFSRSRLPAVIGLGTMGYAAAMFFVVFRAPDLALTQLVVETVTTVLFLLCFYFLPELKREAGKRRFRPGHLTVALGFGVFVTAMALSAQGNRLFVPVSWFFENAYELAGANNIVNAIIVDFRGFDTMLEILVFAMAGLGVYTLIKLRGGGKDHP